MYAKLEEYGEPKRWHRPVRTLLNSWSSFAFWLLGVHILVVTASDAPAAPDSNCSHKFPMFNQLLAVVLIWTGFSSFMFHASLLEIWRVLDAGATMGATIPPLAASLFGACRHNFPHAPAWPFVLAGACGVVGCHLLARTPGWSDIVLPAGIVGTIIIDFGIFAADRLPADYSGLRGTLTLSIVGMLLRLLDMKLHSSRRVPFVWLGHTCWHVLMTFAILEAFKLFRSYAIDGCTARV